MNGDQKVKKQNILDSLEENLLLVQQQMESYKAQISHLQKLITSLEEKLKKVEGFSMQLDMQLKNSKKELQEQETLLRSALNSSDSLEKSIAKIQKSKKIWIAGAIAGPILAIIGTVIGITVYNQKTGKTN